MNNEVIDMIVAEKAKKEIKDLVTDVLAADKAFLQLSGSVNSFSKQSFKVNSVKDYVSHTKEAVKVNNQLNASDKVTQQTGKALTLQFEKRAQASQALNKALIKQRFETQQINKLSKEEAVLTSRVSTFYQKQNVILNKLTRERQSLLLKQNTGIKLSEKEEAQLRRLTAAQTKLDAAFKKTDNQSGRNFRSVGKYTNALKGLRGVVVGLVGAFGLIEGVRASFNFTKEAIALAREAKGVEFAFKRLGDEGQDAFIRIKKATRGLLSDLDIKTAINEFDQFNLSAERADTLFQFLAVAASQTGKSIDELKSSLVEGLSKESKLRIDNLGISTAELNEELAKTPDFLTAVANIAERKVAKAGDILDEAANGGERLSASFENAKLSFGKLFTGESTGLLGAFARQVDRVSAGLVSLKESFGVVKRGIDAFLKPIVDLIKEIPILNKVLGNSKNLFSDLITIFSTPGITAFADFLKEIGAALSGMGAALSAVKLSVVDFVKSLSLIGQIEIDFLNPLKTAKQATSVLASLTNQFAKGGKDVGTAYLEAYRNALKPIEEVNETLVKSNSKVAESLEGANKGREDELSLVEKMIPVYDLLRERVGQMFQEGTLDAIEFRKALEAIDEEQRKLTEGGGASLFGVQGLQGAQITQAQNGTTQDNPIPDTGLVAGEIDLIRNSMGELIDTLGLGQTEFQNFFDSLQTALEKGAEGYDDLKFAAADFLRLAGSGVGALADAKNAAIDQEISDLQRAKEADVNYKRASEAEKERIDAQYAKIIKQKKREQAKNDKDAAVFESIINTIAAVVEALPNVPLSIAVGLIGAANTAAIAAKPLPALKDGDLTGKHQGHVLINDQSGSKYQEIVERQDGSMEMYSGRNVIIDKKRGDKVHKAGTFNGMDLANTSLMLSMQNQQTQLTPSQEQQIINIEIGNQIEKQMSRAINKFQPQKIDYDKLSSTIMWNNEANKA